MRSGHRVIRGVPGGGLPQAGTRSSVSQAGWRAPYRGHSHVSTRARERPPHVPPPPHTLTCGCRTIPESVLKQRTSKLWVAQFTVRFTSKQRFWVEDRQKRVVSGDPKRCASCTPWRWRPFPLSPSTRGAVCSTQRPTSLPLARAARRVQECEDYWVFERPLYLSWFLRKPAPEGARWRLVEQLDTEVRAAATAAGAAVLQRRRTAWRLTGPSRDVGAVHAARAGRAPPDRGAGQHCQRRRDGQDAQEQPVDPGAGRPGVQRLPRLLRMILSANWTSCAPALLPSNPCNRAPVQTLLDGSCRRGAVAVCARRLLCSCELSLSLLRAARSPHIRRSHGVSFSGLAPAQSSSASGDHSIDGCVWAPGAHAFEAAAPRWPGDQTGLV